jgi:two-component system chemotaxis response regulator CheB
VEALSALVRALPPGLPAAVFIVLHIPAQSPSMLPEILNRSGLLIVAQATDGAPIEHGRIYVAPPDHHLLVERGCMRVVRGPRENRHRPAVDPLFRSAALAYGPRVIGVVLTGSLDDGTAGLLAIKRRDGIAVVQDPHEALYPSMPQSALEKVAVDYCLPLASIPPLLVHLANEPPREVTLPVAKDMEMETKIVQMDADALQSEENIGNPSTLSCPECGGVLWELRDGELLRFRCRVGHAFSLDSVLAEQTEAVERALWVALKVLEENQHLSLRIASRAHERGQDWLARRFEARAHDVEQHATLIQQVLLKNKSIDTIYVSSESGNGDAPNAWPDEQNLQAGARE